MEISSSPSPFESIRALMQRMPEVDVQAAGICLDVLETAGVIQRALDEQVLKNTLSRGRFTVLVLLLTAPQWSMTPSDIATAAGVSRATMTGLLDGLEKQDYVTRKPFRTDRRKLTVQLTNKGRECVLEILPVYCQQLAELGSSLEKTKSTV